MSELDGTWKLHRTGGLLPPLLGVHKRIEGTHGETRVGPFPGVPFDVVGLELHYRRPFSGFVDAITFADGEVRGRSLYRGREFGRFTMTRIRERQPTI
jgi:hypothetical protein